MKATEAKLLDFLKKSPQFVIPIYQRTYSWTDRECRQLWEDILRAGGDEQITGHFVGSIVYVEQGLYQVSSQSPLLVIDGQQRLTTCSLIIAALAQALDRLPEDQQEPVPGFSPKKLRNYYLLNPEEAGDLHYKLVLSQTDKDSLMAIVAGREQPNGHSIRIAENFDAFESWLGELKGDVAVVCRGLAKLLVVDISLNRDQDNPQLIFESMNSTGRELTQADLIRNYVLMGLEPKLQTRLYEQYWRPMELDFGQEGYGSHFDAFMRHYLTFRTGEIPRLKDVYEAFKLHARSPQVAADGFENLVADIRGYAGYFCRLALGAEPDPDLKRAFQDLRELKVDTAYPFLLELYGDYADGHVSRDEVLAMVRLVESYVFRRAICAIPTNSLNKTFANVTRELDKSRYFEAVQAHFLLMPSYRRFPGDEEFKRELVTRDIYNSRNRTYLLRRLENFGRKERVNVDEYTIEHILPQNENLNAEWRKDLGEDWERVQEANLHTLGNLTLTGYNSEYSDRPFREKRDMEGGFKVSPLRLNEGLGQLEKWNEEQIKQRAARLADSAVRVWQLPALPAEILATHRGKTDGGSKRQYTIEDHPSLGLSAIKPLFEAFRKAVKQLDPCVTEEFLKQYVAYKAETNFVDVVPQVKRLRIVLNIPFHEINDPRGLCRDITGLGRWGNGDTDVSLRSLEDLPYVIGLVRQAFERQMGNGAGPNE